MSYRFLVPALLATCAPEVPPENTGRQVKDIASTLAPKPVCADADAFRDAAVRSIDKNSLMSVHLREWDATAPPNEKQRPYVQKLAKSYSSQCGLRDAITLAQQLIRYPTVATPWQPADRDVIRAMGSFLRNWALVAELEFESFGDDDAWVVSYGGGDDSDGSDEGEPHVAFVVHADTPPVNELELDENGRPKVGLPKGWKYGPFGGDVTKTRLYGRGAQNNKGPLAVALALLKTMRIMQLEPRGKIMVIIGGDSESGGARMRRYVAANQQAKHVISLDGVFPMVIAEAAAATWTVGVRKLPVLGRTEKAVAVELVGADAPAKVPDAVSLRMWPGSNESLDELAVRATEAVDEDRMTRGPMSGIECSAERTTGNVTLRCQGKAAHVSRGDEGRNALWGIAAIANRLDLEKTGLTLMLRTVAVAFDDDLWGEKLGLAYSNDVTGRLLVIPTAIREKGRNVELTVQLRRPAGLDTETFNRQLDGAVAFLRREVDFRLSEVGERQVDEPSVADLEGPLVRTLLGLYRRTTKDMTSEPIAIRSDTYARLFPGAVSFGPAMPNRPYRGYGPNEFIELQTLKLIGEMLVEATLLLDAEAAGELLGPDPIGSAPGEEDAAVDGEGAADAEASEGEEADTEETDDAADADTEETGDAADADTDTEETGDAAAEDAGGGR